ncbi:MAG: thioredoxin [Candidatus Hydrothermarchaeales archaeon]
MTEGETQEASDHPITITDGVFDNIIKKYPLVLVDFWAGWCHPCRMIEPTIEEVAKENAGKLVCAKLNVDENPNTSAKFRIMSIPTLMLFKDGQQVDTIIGAVPKSTIDERIKPHL